jgi:ornithine carbamoyltransferase
MTMPSAEGPNLRGRSFLKETDLEPGEFLALLAQAAAMKAERRAGVETPRLGGKVIALVFQKTSTRTRAAFEVAALHQGAHVVALDPSGSQLGHKESIADTARVLGRMFDALGYRGTDQSDAEVLAAHAGVPVYNGLTDQWHPTQMLADFLTMQEHAGKPLDEVRFAYLGDCRFNMARSLLVTAALLGLDVRLAGPRALHPPAEVVAIAESLAKQSGARLTITEDPLEAVADADFVHTDVWVSLGESPEVWAERVALLAPYRVTSSLLAATGNPNVRFLHCLPAFHDEATTVGREVIERTGLHDGLEVTDEVFESAASVVFDQAENRLHTIKALLVATLA